MRSENDFLGSLDIPKDALYGIHSLRACDNFPDRSVFHIEWFKAMAMVKKSCYETYLIYYKAAEEKLGNQFNHGGIRLIDFVLMEKLIEAAKELESGLYFDQFIVPSMQGGAGTSINMNVNEIIANRALQLTGYQPGQYDVIDPIETANVFQSTNDVVPTALRIASLILLQELENEINILRALIEKKEAESRHILRIAYTQMQEAVPTSFGKLFSTYSEAFSRDWWRVSKCMERLKTVNIGGSAVGTGVAVPKYFIMEVIQTLQKNSGLPIARSENLADATSNLDSFVECHATLKAHAVNIEKMVSDLRLLSSDLMQSPEIIIPKCQTGSSIMPGKVNPVIPEYAISVAHKVYANDQLISSLAAQGCLELNAYLPVIGSAFLDSLKLLIGACQTIGKHLITGLEFQPRLSYEKLVHSPGIATILLPHIGYHAAAQIARYMKEKNMDIFEANEKWSFVSDAKLREMLKPENLLREGFMLGDIVKHDE